MKFRKTKNTIAAALAVTLVAACSHNGGQDGGMKKSDVGALTGAIAGAWIGSNTGKGKGNILAIATGTLLGAYIGHEVGYSLDRADMQYMQKASYETFEYTPSNTTSRWINPDSGNSGTITPTHTYTTDYGQYCREFTQTINVGGKVQKGYGKACLTTGFYSESSSCK